MRLKRAQKPSAGMTLVELMLAVTIFTVVLGATAHALISYYVALKTQEERVAASQHCVTVINMMRETRRTAEGEFPDTVVEAYPPDTAVPGVSGLRNEQVVVAYEDIDANPLHVTVRSTWRDLRNRPITLAVSTYLTED